MKKCCMSFVFLALLFVFSACPAPGVNEDNSSYITKMKALSSKTFSYFTLDEQEDEIRIKEELVFSFFDEENNTISASLFSASWDSENKTQRGEKIEDMSFTPSEFKKLSFSLDNQRQIDNSITVKNKTYECCSQEYKWAKLLENNKYENKEMLFDEKIEMRSIDLENNKIPFAYKDSYGQEFYTDNRNYYDITQKLWINVAPNDPSDILEIHIDQIKTTSFRNPAQKAGDNTRNYTKVDTFTNKE